MRRHGLPKPYETLKELTRGRRIDRRVVEEFIATLPLDEGARRSLRELNPRSYIGLAAKLVERFAPPVKADIALAKKARVGKR
jgi:adenylosuccinate lyase